MEAARDKDVLELIAFLVTSARNLVSEPHRYGPLRLVEAARRTIELFARCGCSTTFLAEVAATSADMPSLLMKSDEEFIEVLDLLVERISRRIGESVRGDGDATY
ncbi:hypothetical protein KAJ02_03130 [Candidatus Bipolaricaulota bacterium]|nr:hypothetical protein [Candidatus Bipolaricaulota bacterium]MCK5585045.1 hypothetical protein [Candidatus Bipolaricaulota bacterium]